jgi:hypothetical protein
MGKRSGRHAPEGKPAVSAPTSNKPRSEEELSAPSQTAIVSKDVDVNSHGEATTPENPKSGKEVSAPSQTVKDVSELVLADRWLEVFLSSEDYCPSELFLPSKPSLVTSQTDKFDDEEVWEGHDESDDPRTRAHALMFLSKCGTPCVKLDWVSAGVMAEHCWRDYKAQVLKKSGLVCEEKRSSEDECSGGSVVQLARQLAARRLLFPLLRGFVIEEDAVCKIAWKSGNLPTLDIDRVVCGRGCSLDVTARAAVLVMLLCHKYTFGKGKMENVVGDHLHDRDVLNVACCLAGRLQDFFPDIVMVTDEDTYRHIVHLINVRIALAILRAVDVALEIYEDGKTTISDSRPRRTRLPDDSLAELRRVCKKNMNLRNFKTNVEKDRNRLSDEHAFSCAVHLTEKAGSQRLSAPIYEKLKGALSEYGISCPPEKCDFEAYSKAKDSSSRKSSVVSSTTKERVGEKQMSSRLDAYHAACPVPPWPMMRKLILDAYRGFCLRRGSCDADVLVEASKHASEIRRILEVPAPEDLGTKKLEDSRWPRHTYCETCDVNQAARMGLSLHELE